MFLFYPVYRLYLFVMDKMFLKIDQQIILHGEEYLERKEFAPIVWNYISEFIANYEEACNE